jgi:twinkle protein
MKDYADYGIDTRGKASGEVKTTCARCSASRKKHKYPCLNVNVDKGVWNCWHCGWSGSLRSGEESASTPPSRPRVYRPPTFRPTALPADIVAWFARRGIPETILAQHQIGFGLVYMPQVEEEVEAVQFPYVRGGEVVNIKYRDRDKHFRMAAGAERILYGVDDIERGGTLLICEGEMDKLALAVAGYRSCVSVPDGAPAVNTKHYESKFDFLLSAEDRLNDLQRIILAVDTDGPGHKLAEELARRLGPERCYRATWSSECKDANDVLMSYGVETLRECIELATPWPVRGIVTVDMLSAAIDQMFTQGMERGLDPGWSSLAQYYTIRPGELTMVSGIPAHGKSQWVTALMMHLAQVHEWRLAIFSPEHFPLERYAARMLEIYTGQSFGGDEPAMSWDTMQAAKAWLAARVSFIAPDDAAPTIAHLLALARVQVFRQGVKGIVLDPWNEMDHSRPANQTETEYISHALSEIRRFARLHGVHIWVVAHPTKLQKAQDGEYKGQYAPPTPYDISGSAHFRNKADNCVTIWRDLATKDPLKGARTEVHIQKVRFREVGQTGMVKLVYRPACGRYRDATPEELAHWERD